MISFSDCSMPPGMRGLDTSSLKAKPQKDGVDYKLILLDSEAIKHQKPFDHVAYINEKKRRSNSYAIINQFISC